MADRNKKSRSLAIDTKTSSTKRPELSERHKSDTNISKPRESANKHVSSSTKVSETNKRSSKASHADVSSATTRSSDRPWSTQQPNSRRTSQAADPDEIITLTFVVVGAKGVGKSQFARNALDLRKSSGSPITSSKVSLSGNLYRVQLIELLFDDADFSSGRRVSWPRYLNNISFPKIDGAFCLYDVTDEGSVASVPLALGALSNSDIPSTLVACKTEGPEESREVQPRFHEQVRRSFATVGINEISKDEPESAKRCILLMLNRILGPVKRTSQPSSRHPSASRQCQAGRPPASRDTSPEKSQSRSRSHSRLRTSRSKDLLLNIPSRPPLIESADEQSEEREEESQAEVETPPPLRSKLKVDTNNVSHASRRPAEPHTPISSTEDLATSQLISPSEPSQSAIPQTPESYYVKSMLRPGSTGTADSRAFQTFLNMTEDEESHDDLAQADEEEPAKSMKALGLQDTTKQDIGIPFQELVERLLVLPASKQDSKFVPSFLCLYRFFATPKQLLTAIVERFMKTERSNMVRFTKVAEMLRYLQVLGQWTGQYPGDFAEPSAREIATTFVQSLEKNREFGPAAKEISNNLSTVVADDDRDWAYDDSPTSASSKASSGPKKTPASSNTSIPSSMNSFKLSGSGEIDGADDHDGEWSKKTKGLTSASILNTGNSSQSFLNIAQLSIAREESKQLRPNPHIRLSKVQWHQFMDTPLDELAREITRIDWTMYSSIRPRDFVRHVTLSERKRASRRNDNISSMVRQFNHLASFATGMILLRDKPKHRARALEKLMDLAWKVRQLNNYNSLGAIKAGIDNQAITRLVATHELVPMDKQKQFLRLKVLMGHSRSSAAYRMAWENSFAERIPFIPLLRQDLTMASSANQTFFGSNINWKKFDVMGEAIVSVQRSLEQPYSFSSRVPTTDQTIKLILETRIFDGPEDSADPGDEIYKRSLAIEPPAGGADVRKKSSWLSRR